MLVSLCDCNRRSPFLHSKTLLNSSFQIPNCYHSIVQFKPRRRRASVSAAAPGSDTQALPQSAIRRIAEKLRSLGYAEESSTDSPDEASTPGGNSPGEIFVPLPTRLPNYRVGHTLDPSWSTPHNPIPDPGTGSAIQRFHELRRGVLEEEEKERIRKRSEGKKGKAPTLAELTLPKEELTRLTTVGIGLKKKIKVGKAGITEGIVNGIHERWRRSELVKIACDDICRLNMKRTHELLERKTGGLVVWRSGGNIILYRGSNYKYPYFIADDLENEISSGESSDVNNNQGTLSEVPSPVINAAKFPERNSDIRMAKQSLVQGVGVPNRVRFQLPGEVQIAEEADALLEGLGPRFTDWWGYDPLPVDADLLPAVVPGYRAPFRLLPYGVQPKLTNDEMNTLRRLGRPLPCHFALGRNRRLQGLAAAIVKLWEKCEIAKIAVKRGVQNTNSLLMAEELKRWTGGTLLSRDKEFIVFYRGKDFLPAAVSSAIEERRKYGMVMSQSRTSNLKEHEYGAREYDTNDENDEVNDKKLRGNSKERELRLSEAKIARTSNKLSLALAKKAQAEKLLAKLQEEETPQEPEMDKEGITEEERHMLRKVGLRMKPFLLLGRRGVFDGTVENMHLHWKYRELVKVCVGQRRIEEIHGIARTLEAESGGILVAIERLSKGFAIIVYRGKNYKRPASLRPRTLLSKRAAMKRSLEAQRRESLKLHVLKLNSDIDELKLKMANEEGRNSTQLTKDQEQGFEINKNHHDNDDKLSRKDPAIDYESLPGECVNEAIKSGSIDETSNKPEVSMHIPNDSMPLVQELPGDTSLGHAVTGDTSLGHAVKGNYLYDSPETEIQLESQPKGTKGFLNLSDQSGNAELPYNFRTQDQTSSSTHQPQTGHKDSNVDGCKNTEIQPFHAQNAMDEKSPTTPFRASRLSNRERLILRKQALQMKNPPVLAVGKSNVITGIAKVIKAHFEKHPLVIVNIKGRAKGTSAQEVIYNLEQATGAVLVSQEPSKVILYRGWGSGTEPGEASGKANKSLKDDSGSVGVKARPFLSPELISAIRDECGLKSVKDENIATDDNPDGQ